MLKGVIKQGLQKSSIGQIILSFSRPASVNYHVLLLTDEEWGKHQRSKKKALEIRFTNAQLRTCWMWAKDAEKAGIGSYDIADHFYTEFKFKFLAPVICESDEDYAGLHERTMALQAIMGNEWIDYANQFYSIKDGSIAQIAKAMDSWKMWLVSKGVNIRDPEFYKSMLQHEYYKKQLAK